LKPNQSCGVVAASAGRTCTVWCGGETRKCHVTRPNADREHLLPVVGDEVILEDRAGTYLLTSILPRRTAYSRFSSRPPFARQVIAANAGTLLVVVSVEQPPLHPRLIDRFLVLAADGGLAPAICLNKADLPNAASSERALHLYRDIGVPVHTCSASTGAGIAELLRSLSGKSAVLVGHSGVGKSSLLNAILPGLSLSTGSVRRADGKGRHTTTSSTLYPVDSKTYLIDTPGIRECGLRGVDWSCLLAAFPEIERCGAECDFRDCTHTGEPGCSVRAALRMGAVSQSRYESFQDLTRELFAGKCHAAGGRSGPTFECVHCGKCVADEGAGSRHRNHCPGCLWSVHLDNIPGDRGAHCGGPMEPIAVWVRKGGEWAVIHRCTQCGQLRSNRIASDDNEMLLLSLAARPISSPPFPIEVAG